MRAREFGMNLEQLGGLRLFSDIKKTVSFANFPGSYRHRRFQSRDVICRQKVTSAARRSKYSLETTWITQA